MVIGVSGTGSVAGEQINRLGFGRVKHCDFDVIEFKNINRILNSRISDAASGRLKVDMFVEAVKGYRRSSRARPSWRPVNATCCFAVLIPWKLGKSST